VAASTSSSIVAECSRREGEGERDGAREMGVCACTSSHITGSTVQLLDIDILYIKYTVRAFVLILFSLLAFFISYLEVEH